MSGMGLPAIAGGDVVAALSGWWDAMRRVEA